MINKNTLQSVISKYYLNGTFNPVKWRIKDNTLTVYAGAGGKAAKVHLKNFQFEDCELGIFDTQKLAKLLAVTNGVADNNFDLNYSLADIFVIPKASYFPDIEEPDALFELDKEAIDALIKAKTALADQNTLLVKTTSNLDGELVCEMIFGDLEDTSNKITYTLNGKINNEIEFPLNSDTLKDIFGSNKDADRGTLKISADGMMQINFYSDEIESEYFVLRNE